MVIAKKFVLERRFDGIPQKEDLKLVEEELPPLEDGEFLAEAIYISVDPYQRLRGANLELGSTFIGRQIARVIESKSDKYPVGTQILGNFGWRNYTIASETPTIVDEIPLVLPLPDLDGLPVSLGLGALGFPGLSAYFGFLEICKPKQGETVVISGAAGAVGNLVGQIAKIKGCHVIGIAGSEEKGRWLRFALGFDGFVNYKNPDFQSRLKELVPNGIDCYFDNVGGVVSSAVLSLMNHFGRVSICGSISAYNSKPDQIPLVPAIQSLIIGTEVALEGFLVKRWIDKRMEGLEQLKIWIQEGRLKSRETITEGFENIFDAFLGLFYGDNIGKAIVRA